MKVRRQKQLLQNFHVFWVHQTFTSVKALVSYLLVFNFCNIMDKVKDGVIDRDRPCQ